MRLILTIAMALALAVTAQAHLTTELLAQAVLENLVGGGFSMQCSEDLGRVYQNQKVIGAMGKLSDDANQEGQLIGQTCAATAFPCITAFGQGTCCSVEGPQVWKKHLDDIDALQKAGQSVTQGYVAVSSQILTLRNGASAAVTTVAMSYMQPSYMPASCVNAGDAQAFNAASTQACFKAIMPGNTILDCGVQWS